jgi:serine/threonine protein kinase
MNSGSQRFNSTEPLKWRPGDRFGNHQIQSVSFGGMGIVLFLGAPFSSSIAWAAKSFRDEFMQEENVIVSFWNEAQHWMQLGRHKNIVYADHVFEVEGKPYIYLEYMDGGSLRKIINEKSASIEKIIDIAVQICCGMEYAWHNGKLIHRDLKPENILFNRRGEAKITDWGLSKVMDRIKTAPPSDSGNLKASLHKTRGGVALGTPPYMPPEQFEDARNTDRAADIYSFGVMLFEMIAGRLPFIAYDAEEFYYKHKNKKPPVLSSICKWVPEIVSECVQKALEKDPQKRFASFEEIGDLLIEVQGSHGSNRKIKDLIDDGTAVMSSHELTQHGFGLLHLRRDREAIQYFNKAIQSDPDNWEAYGYKSYCLGNLKLHEEAISSALHSLKINPGFAHAWANLGYSYSETKQHEKAFAAYEKAIRLNPQDVTHYNNICISFINAGQFDKAIQYAKKGLSIKPDYWRLWLNLSSALSKTDRHNESVDAAKHALNINPRCKGAYMILYEIYKKIGMTREAKDCLEKASRIDSRYTT